jgi:hypothetical protein
VIKTLAAAIALILVTTHAFAQQRMFALVPDAVERATHVWEVRIDNGVASEPRRRALVAGLGSGPVVAGGGQFLLWSAIFSLSIPRPLVGLDRTSGATFGISTGLSLGGAAYTTDPSRPRVFLGAGDIRSVSPSGIMILPGTSGLSPSAAAADGTRLYATRVVGSGSPTTLELLTLDPESGALLAEPVTVEGNLMGIVPARDHATIWTIMLRPGSLDTRTFVRLDLSSGEELFATPLLSPDPSLAFFSLVGVDQQRGRAFLLEHRAPGYAPGDHVSILHTYDSATGAPVAAVRLDGLADAGLDAGAGQVLVLSQSAEHATLHTISATTGQLTSSAPLGHIGPVFPVAFAAPPLPPSLDAPVVSSTRSVTLSWTPSPEQTTHVTVEAGSAPGLANLAMMTVPTGRTLTVPDVPPGTYYVRVKAANYIGDSVPSNEIVVSVP